MESCAWLGGGEDVFRVQDVLATAETKFVSAVVRSSLLFTGYNEPV
jgi:hypothetical protein